MLKLLYSMVQKIINSTSWMYSNTTKPDFLFLRIKYRKSILSFIYNPFHESEKSMCNERNTTREVFFYSNLMIKVDFLHSFNLRLK